MFERVLVALDGADSETVIAMLQQLQWHPAAEAVIAHVLVNTAADPDIAADRPQADVETIPQQQLERLQAYQSQLPCKSKIELVTCDPAEEIVRLAHLYQTDLIVMGSRGLTGLKRVLQGSVSNEVAELAPCSVLIVKLK